MSYIDYAIIAGFLVIMAGAGVMISRLIKDSDDIFVAGRELTPFILCATITATNLSMFQFIGMGGIAYQSGASIVWQNWTGDIALVLSGMFVVPIMRRLRIRSVPELLEIRYGRGLRTLTGAFWGIRLCVYLGILLYIASTAAIIITGAADTSANYIKWLVTFSVISIIYSTVGGAWAVAIMDSVQFCVMLAGALILLPIATHAAGGMPAVIKHFNSIPGDIHAQLVPHTGEFNWLFIAAILLLGFKWSTVDQAILQRAFGARTPRIAAKGMILSAIITTPFAFFWVLPGMAAAKMHPGLSNPDAAIPWMLAHTIPVYWRGLLGIVLCGLIAAQISAITADVNSVATLFTSDVYRTFFKHELSQKHIVRVVRISSVLCGMLMLWVAWLLHGYGAGAVKANLVVVGILDMPLFVITIVYGLFWKRANWQGALCGFLLGGSLGILTHFLILSAYFDKYIHPNLAYLPGFISNPVAHFHASMVPYEKSVRNIVPFVSTITALIVTPIVSLLVGHGRRDASSVWDAFKVKDADGDADSFHLIPVSFAGRTGMGLVFVGLAAVIVGIVLASQDLSGATASAVIGMLVVFSGGLIRVYNE